MPVKNLSKIEKGPDKKVYNITPSKEDRLKIKELLKKKKEVLKSVSGFFNLNEEISIKIILDDEADLSILGQHPLGYEWEDILYFGKMKANKKEISEISRLLISIWNEMEDYIGGDIYKIQHIIDESVSLKEEFNRRTEMMESVNQEFISFFKYLEKQNDAKGLVETIKYLNWREMEELIEAISKGNEVEIS